MKSPLCYSFPNSNLSPQEPSSAVDSCNHLMGITDSSGVKGVTQRGDKQGTSDLSAY